MINTINAELVQAVVHHLGKKSDGEQITFSKSPLDTSDRECSDILLRYVTSPFKEPHFFHFTFHDGDFVMNPMYNYIGNVFDDPDSLYEHSVKIASLLFEKSDNPMIKHGELCICYLRDILVDDELIDAIAIFKSEEKDTFFNLREGDNKFNLSVNEGTSISKVDKACLILNTERDIGFKILNIDHSNRNVEAKYWRDQFLILDNRNDDFHNTTSMIKMTAEFVKKRLPADAPIDKAEQAAIMNRSADYFKNQESFELKEYNDHVFREPQVVQSFMDFADEKERDINQTQNFAINDYAVKRQSRVFKSVIKLDKNFHIYVHGDHSKITKGELENGQKYYMLYYDEER